MTARLHKLAARLREERGFTMVVVMGVLLVATAFSVAALAAADNDDPQSRHDQDSKRAYAAAEAGIANYVFHIENDPSFWAQCSTPVTTPPLPTPTGLNPAWIGSGPDPRTSWRNVPSSSAQWAVELLPANGASQCDKNNPDATMIDTTTGTFSIRSTGRSSSAANAVKRSIVATFRRRSFLDYVWFTDYEDMDPAISGDSVSGCTKYFRDGRSGCTEIQFRGGDGISGPFHTNDQFLVCNSPTFGRQNQTPPDKIESSDPNLYRVAGGCSNSPVFYGTQTPSAALLSLPPSNISLGSLASGIYKPTGQTDIILNGNQVCIRAHVTPVNTNPASCTAAQWHTFPPNGVIYVQNGTCGVAYNLTSPYTVPSGCGEAWVSGNYAGNLTIGADKDVVIDGDLTATGTNLLGLIANNYVRIYHPVTGVSGTGTGASCTNATGTMTNVNVNAAILSLNHSFLVDYYMCGAQLGTLHIKGAIAQKFRGPVGQSGGSPSGYTKDYQYDDQLGYREPPSFLDPVQTSWKILRYTEQLPPR
ncbi:MAG: hypothetical protein ACJ77M_09315 [Thermoleophilaceae bacterium]